MTYFQRNEAGWIGVLVLPDSGDVFYLIIGEYGCDYDDDIYNAQFYSCESDVMRAFENSQSSWYGFKTATCTPKFMTKETKVRLYDGLEVAIFKKGPENGT